jgi:hypothetical protein
MKTILLLLAALATSHSAMAVKQAKYTWSYNEKDVFDGDGVGVNGRMRGPVGKNPMSKGANKGPSSDGDDDDDEVSLIRMSALST